MNQSSELDKLRIELLQEKAALREVQMKLKEVDTKLCDESTARRGAEHDLKETRSHARTCLVITIVSFIFGVLCCFALGSGESFEVRLEKNLGAVLFIPGLFLGAGIWVAAFGSARSNGPWWNNR